MSKCAIIALLKLMWLHNDLDMNQQDRINAIENTELVYQYSLNNNFDPFATFSMIYNESRFRKLQDSNTASCGALQVAHAYINDIDCNQLKEIGVSLNVAFEFHINVYVNKFKYTFKKQDVVNKNYKAPDSLKQVFRLYAAGPNCQNKEDECYKKSERQAQKRISTRNMLHRIFLENYKRYSNNIHLMVDEKCTNSE